MRYLRVFVVLLMASPALQAAEGMWTLDNLPRKALHERYGFSPDAAWIDHAMKSSVRLAGGCSGSFISPDGLVLTNDHCVIGCVSQLSSAEKDYVGKGFVARERGQEMQCPDIELNRLERITDITDRIQQATTGLSGDQYSAAKKAVQSKLESECVGEDSQHIRCDVVELYQGGVQQLYRYHRFQDVRLVFAPEYASGFFGGDPDNFNFPRYNLDMGLLRAYEDGKPAKVADYFQIDTAGAQPGELVMTLGHPGTTQRLLTVAQLETQRDRVLLTRLLYLSELRGLLTRFAQESAENARIVQSPLTSVENSIKVYQGELQALLDSSTLDTKRKEEVDLKAYVNANPARKQQYGDAWDKIAAAQRTYRDLFVRYDLIENGRGFLARYFNLARLLVRAADERAKPNGERLREFADANLPRLQQQVLAQVPHYPEYEKVRLAWSLTKLRAMLGADDPFVRLVLGKESPEALAARLIDGSRLGDVEFRRTLWDGKKTAGADTDPMIALVRKIDGAAREVRAKFENEVEAVEEKNAERLAAARFARYGTGIYPDATFTLRLSYGEIRGWDEQGKAVPPYTDMAGLFARATDADPYRLAPRWIEAKDRLNLSTRMNQVSTNDIIGGNSGSPLINRKGQIVGLVFDGNIHSLGGAYFFDERLNRTVSVHSAAIIEALRKVYGADPIADEMLEKGKADCAQGHAGRTGAAAPVSGAEHRSRTGRYAQVRRLIAPASAPHHQMHGCSATRAVGASYSIERTTLLLDGVKPGLENLNLFRGS